MWFQTLLLEYNRAMEARKLGVALVRAWWEDRTVPVIRAPGADRLTMKPELWDALKHGTLPPDLTQQIAEEILELIEKKDPSPNKQYVQWIARMYSKGGVKFEDLNRHNTIGTFHTLKTKKRIRPEHADINRFKTYKDFEDAILSYPDIDPKQQQDRGQYEEFFEDATVRIVIPRNEAAACFWGKGTRWCTAATKSDNMYSQYAEQGDLYIFLPKTAQHPGEKYQLLVGDSLQLMNEEDEVVALRDLQQRFPNGLHAVVKKEPAMEVFLLFAPPARVARAVNVVQDVAKSSVQGTLGVWFHRDLESSEYGGEVYGSPEAPPWSEINPYGAAAKRAAQKTLYLTYREFVQQVLDNKEVMRAYAADADGNEPSLANIGTLLSYHFLFILNTIVESEKIRVTSTRRAEYVMQAFQKANPTTHELSGVI